MNSEFISVFQQWTHRKKLKLQRINIGMVKNLDGMVRKEYFAKMHVDFDVLVLGRFESASRSTL